MPSREAHSRFLALPTEIRLNIYGHLFAGNEVRVYSYHWHRLSRSRRRTHAFQIALTCRLCLGEALPLYYSATQWNFEEDSQLWSFCYQADPSLLQRVKHLYLHSAWCLKQLPLQKLGSLTRVEVDVTNQIKSHKFRFSWRRTDTGTDAQLFEDITEASNEFMQALNNCMAKNREDWKMWDIAKSQKETEVIFWAIIPSYPNPVSKKRQPAYKMR